MSTVANTAKPQGCCQKIDVFPFVTQILSMSLGFIAFVMSAAVVSQCDFFKVTGLDSTFGLFKIRTTDTSTCFDLDELVALTGLSGSVVPPSWKAAAAMGAIAATFGGITSLTCFFMLFFRFPGPLFKTLGGLYIFCFVIQMLTLLVINNALCTGEMKCKLRGNAFASIIAAIFYLAIGITMSICPVPKTAVMSCCGGCCSDEGNECGDCCGEQSVQVVEHQSVSKSLEGRAVYMNDNSSGGGGNSKVTETYNADGSVTIFEERVNPDGSITRSTTTRPPTSV